MQLPNERNSRRRVHSKPSSLLYIPTVSHSGLIQEKNSLGSGSFVHSLSMALMAPRHGVGACVSGCRIRSLSTDCNRIGLSAVEAPLGGIGKEALFGHRRGRVGGGRSERYNRSDRAGTQKSLTSRPQLAMEGDNFGTLSAARTLRIPGQAR